MREAAEGLLVVEQKRDERRQEVAEEQQKLYRFFKSEGLHVYKRWFDSNQAEYLRHWPELCDNFQEQRSLMEGGLQPFAPSVTVSSAEFYAQYGRSEYERHLRQSQSEPSDKTSEQLRRMALGYEPFDGADSRRREYIRNFQGSKEGLYAGNGKATYHAQLLRDRPCYESLASDLLPEVDSQLQRMKDDLEPFEGADSRRRECLRKFQSSKGRVYASLGLEAYQQQLELDRLCYQALTPELFSDVEEQLRRMGDGQEPFEGADRLRADFQRGSSSPPAAAGAAELKVAG
eukprot:TRINITY_DN43015_c0_g3_i3.p1 TRINITY_DN43015_c0_g3~~TRINITY_DN43015_c0_g3_i3.p1  ORF type:complete len:289 (+),score=58.92 TRINITY_DN43015_c0_g3_i3:615-1481(+)